MEQYRCWPLLTPGPSGVQCQQPRSAAQPPAGRVLVVAISEMRGSHPSINTHTSPEHSHIMVWYHPHIMIWYHPHIMVWYHSHLQHPDITLTSWYHSYFMISLLRHDITLTSWYDITHASWYPSHILISLLHHDITHTSCYDITHTLCYDITITSRYDITPTSWYHSHIMIMISLTHHDITLTHVGASPRLLAPSGGNKCHAGVTRAWQRLQPTGQI